MLFSWFHGNRILKLINKKKTKLFEAGRDEILLKSWILNM